jgi:DNA-binding XRE family transcriptional regulator
MRGLRDRLKMTQDEFGIALGIPREAVIGYEKGVRNGRPFPIPRSVELACAALAQDITAYVEEEDELKVDVFRLMTRSGLRQDVLEWMQQNLKKAAVVHNGVATFSDVTDAVFFKMTWSGEFQK